MTSTASKKGHEQLHDSIRNVLITKILPKEFPGLVRALKPLYCYPVIIGGALIQRCAKRSALASWFIRDILSEDVDIKFVVRTHVESNDNSLIKRIDAERVAFRARIKKALEAHIAKFHNGETVLITVQENDAMMGISIEKVRRAMVRQLEITYVEAMSGIRRAVLPIMDMNIFTEYSMDHYWSYSDWVNSRTTRTKLVHPVPKFNLKGVLYATCEYAYYDTLRMCIDRMAYFNEKRTMYALTKLTRYIIKLMCLWSLRKEANVDKDIMELYRRAHRVLSHIDGKKLQEGLLDPGATKNVKYGSPEVTWVSSLLERVVKVTNVEELARVVSEDHRFTPFGIRKSGGGRTTMPLHEVVSELRTLLTHGRS
jgi:hypothetical protein